MLGYIPLSTFCFFFVLVEQVLCSKADISSEDERRNIRQVLEDLQLPHCIGMLVNVFSRTNFFQPPSLLLFSLFLSLLSSVLCSLTFSLPLILYQLSTL